MPESPTEDKTRVGTKAQEGNETVTDVSKAALKADAKKVSTSENTKDHTGTTATGEGLRPAASTGTSDVAPIVKQNQNTDEPAISITPPVYGHAGIKDVSKAKNDWEVAEAKAEARYGLPFLDTKTKEQRKQLVEDEFRRLHNGSLDEDVQTSHVSNEPLEYHGNVHPGK